MSAEDALAKLEAQVLKSSGVGKWLTSVDTLRTLLAMGEPSVIKIMLALNAPRVEAQALAAVLDAYGIGAADARTIIAAGADELAELARRGKPSKDALAIVRGLDKGGRQALAQARKLAASGADAQTALAPVLGHANRVRGSVREGVNMSGNEGSTAMADAAGLSTVWVAETDACVHCLAYSGQIAKPGKEFPGGLTYGKKSYHPGKLKHPPLHPGGCRCTVEPLNDPSYAKTLRREADRSVLRGFSLQSESMGQRVDAAERLLQRDPTAPASVKSFARRAVKAGKFPTRGRPGE